MGCFSCYCDICRQVYTILTAPYHHMPVIAIEGMIFRAPIGVYEAEKILGSELEVSVKIALKESKKPATDNLGYTVDYENVYELISKTIAQPVNLLETAVSRIISAILLEYPEVARVKIRVAKLHPPLNGIVKKVWVEESRYRDA